MTLQEIQKLRKENPREFDALVAEKVHGWVKGKNRKGFNGWAWNHETDEPATEKEWDGQWIRSIVDTLEYHSDANADLESHKVACGRILSKRMKYFEALHELWASRFETNNVDCVQYIGKYQIGDFSMIALCVAMEEKK